MESIYGKGSKIFRSLLSFSIRQAKTYNNQLGSPALLFEISKLALLEACDPTQLKLSALPRGVSTFAYAFARLNNTKTLECKYYAIVKN